jgi:cytochrome c-type biogenesis protein CcmF
MGSKTGEIRRLGAAGPPGAPRAELATLLLLLSSRVPRHGPEEASMVAGDVLLKLSTLCALVAFVAALRWARGHTPSERTFRWAYHAMTATLLASSGLLMLAILRHDFRFEYVINYSSRDLPLLYLISAFWAGQQGTYLLWALCGALLGYALVRRNAWEPARVMTFYLPTVTFMHLLMLNPAGNPFHVAPSFPLDGNGLNPLLQDPWMASHPPLVFLGYAAAALPAALALTALLRREGAQWVDQALRWALLSFVLLGAGIVLGGFWAYKVLGWGGYWGWDPVENASLIPWLLVTALLHGLLVQKAGGALVRTNLALALASYATVFYATFLTRSGVLADFSVHSFPAGSIYRILLGIQLTIVVVSVAALLYGRSLSGKEIALSLAWPLKLTGVIVLLGISAAFVLIGTSWPIITSWLGEPSSFGPSWYNTVNLPVYVVALALLGIAPFLGWAPRPWHVLRGRLAFAAVFAATATALAYGLGARGGAALLLFCVAMAALGANALRLVEVGRTRLLNGGAALAHIGFALMFAGIVGSSFWGQGAKVDLPQGEPVEVLGRTLTFVGHVDGSEPQDRWRIEIAEPGREPYDADVAMYRTSERRDAEVMHKPAIVRRLAGDLYIAPGGLRAGGETVEFTLTKGRPTPLGNATVTFEAFRTEGMGGRGMVVWADVTIEAGGRRQQAGLPYKFIDGKRESLPVAVEMSGAGVSTLTLVGMSVEQGTILIQAAPEAAAHAAVLAVDVSTKPMIGLLWGGTVLLGVGCGVAWWRRVADARLIARARAEAERRAPAAGKAGSRPGRARKQSRPRPAHAR